MKVDPRSFKGLSRFLAPSSGGPVADRAVNERLITADQLQECVAEQDRSGRPLDEILVERGYLKPEDVERLRAPAVPAEVVPWLTDPDRNLDHYVLVSLLGTGGMAEVWKAWDRSLGRWVAVKYLKREIGHPTQRIEREGRMAGQLSHPSIITIFERGQHDGRAYLVMPFVDGAPPRSPLPPREAARLALEVARALEHVHEAGVIHRDVKPANILVAAGGRVVLADFGLAILDETATSRWAMSGTPEYASPEQIRGDALDARTDIYSLGATLYQFLVGRPPYGGSGVDEITRNVLAAGVPPMKGIPRGLVAIVRKCMAPERDRRYASIPPLIRDLEAWIVQSTPGSFRKPMWIGIAVLVVLVSWGTTFFILLQSQSQDDRQRVLEALREGDRKLASAERRTADDNPARAEQDARGALSEYSLALRWSGDRDLEARVGIGRCFELLGEDEKAEMAYREAGDYRPARAALVWIWARRMVDGGKQADWKALVRKHAPPGHLAALYAEGRWEAVLQARSTDREDETPSILQAAAALELKRWDDAAGAAEAGLRRRPRDAALHLLRGRALAGKGDRAGAETAWNAALRHAPKDWPLRDEVQRLLTPR